MVQRSTTRLLRYIAQYSAVHSKIPITCKCAPPIVDKNLPGSDSVSSKTSKATRIAQYIASSKGGSAQYGNFYLGHPLEVNYLGRMSGMPGGSGKPPTNRF